MGPLPSMALEAQLSINIHAQITCLDPHVKLNFFLGWFCSDPNDK
jgi:hypothetical protein